MKSSNDKIIMFLTPETVEPQAYQQLENMAKLPFVFHHIAAMPDCHLGMGATVGSVIATQGAIIPAAVGVDIGCGMIAVKTKYFAKDLPDSLDKIRDGIERRIPLGAGGCNSKVHDSALNRVLDLQARVEMQGLVDRDNFVKDWRKQLGTLGSGNHFIEMCLDENQQIWVVLHSGSRGIGNRLAQKHIKIAKGLMETFFIDLDDIDLAYLPENTPEFKSYIDDLLWAQEYARMNRDEMMDRIMTELSYLFFNEIGHQSEIEVDRINCHHNFTQKENHYNHNVWITRKGAIQMRNGQMGVIPGSMGTRSYIVSGLENRESFHSAPHGAGRRMSRTAARKMFTMEDMEKTMEGICWRPRKELIDEIPGAYKDIDTVMENSKELVKVEHTLKQILNVKGD